MQRICNICIGLILFIFLAPAGAAIPKAKSLQQSSQQISNTQLRLRIGHYSKEILISGFGLQYGLEDELRFLSDHLGMAKVSVIQRGGIFKLKNTKTGKELYHKGSIVFQAEELNIAGSPILKEVQLVPDQQKAFHVILSVPMSEYLLGVLPAEMPAYWPYEALKAQAVASRSYAFSVKERRKHQAFDLEVTVSDQVYNMNQYLKLPKVLKAKVRRAIVETQGEVLRKPNHNVMKTYFHAHCGGRTKTSMEVWGVKGQDVVVHDEHCAVDREADWSFTLSADLLKKQFFASEDQGDIKLEAKDGVQVKMNLGEKAKSVAGDLFRKVVGYANIKAAEFKSKINGETIELEGRGYGHGVGMCQSGARFMAQAGSNYLQILKRYYGRAPEKTKMMASSHSLNL